MELKTITQEMTAKLRQPLPDEAVSQHPTKKYLSSIKGIYVTERLNEVFGIGSWRVSNEIVSHDANGMVVLKVKLSIPAYGIELESFGGNDNGGEGSKNFDLGDAYKGATTDALTKIGSYLEIGIDVFKDKQKGKESQQESTPELKWLNRQDKAGNILPEYMNVIRRAKEKGMTAEDLKGYYKINKQVFECLQNDIDEV